MSVFRYPLLDPAECTRRGGHGPFVNVQRYATVTGWEGMGECAMCGSTVLRPGERAVGLLSGIASRGTGGSGQ